MNKITLIAVSAAISAFGALGSSGAMAQDKSMSFFITGQGPGDGANLGGLKGADAYCQTLGGGGKTWRAYLSTDKENARDRIGKGPWHNAKGMLIAKDLAALHGAANAINKQNGLSEKGAMINGRGDSPNRHDILTGSKPDGTVVAGKTCSNWTNNGPGTAIVGHHDRKGLRDDAPSKSWNSSHPTRACDQASLRRTGGDGLFYCFAVK